MDEELTIAEAIGLLPQIAAAIGDAFVAALLLVAGAKML
jgi:hypothetical protein